MRTSRADPPKKLPQINDGHKITRRLTREISISHGLLMEDYYYHEGASVSVPFRWESEPGTPKIRYRDLARPPLTPPPSYSYNSSNPPIGKNPKKSSLLGTVFTKRATRKTNNVNPSSPSSSSSSSASSSRSSSYSVPSSSMIKASNFRPRYEISSPRLSCDSRARYDEEEHHEYGSSSNASPALCSSRGANARPRGLYSYLIKVLMLKNSQ